jgi:ketopantoate reductase
MADAVQDVAVVGARGRIGALLCGLTDGPWRPLGVTRDHDPVGLGRQGPSIPIVVCTRNDDLDDVLAMVHPSRVADLVLVQNGTVRGWLERHGLSGLTRGVLWVAVPKVGDAPVPGGTSVFWGRHARTVAGMLDAHGIDAAAVDEATFAREEAVKLAWICAVGLVGSATGAKVGEISAQHGEVVAALVRELHPVLRARMGLKLGADALVDRVEAYSARIPHFPARVKEWPWRNGWVLDQARALGLSTALQDEWRARGQ